MSMVEEIEGEAATEGLCVLNQSITRATFYVVGNELGEVSR
jgi:hypothetical protein